MTTLANRFTEIIRAYAAGDAYGVQYEFKPRSAVAPDDVLREVDGWPAGGVSDDTLLTLMTLEALIESSTPESAADNFRARLFVAKESLRGLGPTTRAALGLEVKPDELEMVGRSNGGLMRCALVGLAFNDDEKRRVYVDSLTRVTHQHDRAVVAALVGSRLIADAVRLGSAAEIDDAVHDESPEFATEILGFEPSEEGVTLDPIETLGAAILACKEATSVNEAFKAACSFGGDTDTTAALAGALYAARHPLEHGLERIVWLAEVQWSEIPQLGSVAAKLAEIRLGA